MKIERDIMKPISDKEDVPAISDSSRALLWSVWQSSGTSLSYGMRDYEPSDEALACLSELTDAGIIVKKTNGDEQTWRLTQAGKDMDRVPPGGTHMDKIEFMREHGNFPLAKAREPDPDFGM